MIYMDMLVFIMAEELNSEEVISENMRHDYT